MKILNFGSLNIDKVYAVEKIVKGGETIDSVSFSESVGGKGLNQSIAVAKAAEISCMLVVLVKMERFYYKL